MTEAKGLEAEVQRATTTTNLPTDEQIRQWLDSAFPDLHGKLVLIRFVDETESSALNDSFRGKSGPTNILSFPLELPADIPNSQLGDLVICTQVTQREASEQQKSIQDHYCHLLIHGVLHLLGFDHINVQDAAEMETREIELLGKLGISNPYT